MLEPFTINVSESILTDLAERLDKTRLPESKGFEPWADGTPSILLKNW